MKEDNHIIEITPELERRVLQDRRREPRAKFAELERRLASIAAICEICGPEADLVTLDQIYRLAVGLPASDQHSEKPESQPDSSQINFGGHTEPGQHFTNEPK